MPDWIIALIILMILGIVLDGLRRVRIRRKENIQISKRATLADKEVSELNDSLFDEHASEFPSGGARRSSQTANNKRAEKEPSDNTLVFNEPVPMLMESVIDDGEVSGAKIENSDNHHNDEIKDSYVQNHQNHDRDSSLATQVSSDQHINVPHPGAANTNINKPNNHNPSNHNPSKHESAKASLGILADAPGKDDSLDYEMVDANALNVHSSKSELDLEYAVGQDTTFDDGPNLGSLDDLDDLAPSVNQSNQRAPKHNPKLTKRNPLNFKNYTSNKSKQDKPSQESKNNEPEEVIIINIMAKKGTFFDGEPLLQAFVDNDLKFGERDIFHRHVHQDGNGGVLFSIANIVVPGTFNLVDMAQFSTPGVSIFMTLPVEEESLIAFNIMIETAKNLAKSLNGELKDENRSVMTAQTIEHAKEKVLEYERKRKLRNR